MPAKKKRVFIVRLSQTWYEIRVGSKYPTVKISFAKLVPGERESRQVDITGGKVICTIHYADLYTLVASRMVSHFPDHNYPVLEVNDKMSTFLLDPKWRAKHFKRSS